MAGYNRNPQTIPDDSPGGSTTRQAVKDQNSEAIDNAFTSLNIHSNNEDGLSHAAIDAKLTEIEENYLGEMQDLVDEAEGYKNDSANSATDSATDALNSSNSAQDSANCRQESYEQAQESKAFRDDSQTIYDAIVPAGDAQVARVIAEGDTQEQRVIDEGTAQIALATAQADRSEDEADRAQGYADSTGNIPLMSSSVLSNWTTALSVVADQLVVTNGYFNYTNGLTEKGYASSSRTVTRSIDASLANDGWQWGSENDDGTTSWFDYEPQYQIDGFAPWFNSNTGKWMLLTNILDNGNFTEGDLYWDIIDTNWSIANGLATSDGGTGFLGQTNTLIVGNEYTFEYTVNISSGSVKFYSGAGGDNATTRFSSGTYKETFTVGAPTAYLYGIVFDGSVSNLTITPTNIEESVEILPAPSFVPVPVFVAGGKVQYLGDAEIAQNYVDSLAVKQIRWVGDGVPYDDPDAIGANPVAKIYPDGTIVGSTDNGSYTKYPNGDLLMYRTYEQLWPIGVTTVPSIPGAYKALGGGIAQAVWGASTNGWTSTGADINSTQDGWIVTVTMTGANTRPISLTFIGRWKL